MAVLQNWLEYRCLSGLKEFSNNTKLQIEINSRALILAVVENLHYPILFKSRILLQVFVEKNYVIFR